MVLSEFADPIFSIGLIVFAISLAPSVYKKAGRSIPLTTSVPTVALQGLLSATFLELGFYGTALTGFFLTDLWGALMIQRVKARADNMDTSSNRR